MVVQTKTYTSLVSTLPKSISDKTAAKEDKVYARAWVNKDFVHSGSIGLIWGKHARYVITAIYC